MTDSHLSQLKFKVLTHLAQHRALAIATSELGFRESFRDKNNLFYPEDINMVYARVNARFAEQQGYTIHLNILPNETSLKALKCVKERADNLVEPHHLAQELIDYITNRDNKSGLLVLAIDRVHMLSSNKRKMLVSIFDHFMLRFAVLILVPKEQWIHIESRDVDYDKFNSMFTFHFRNEQDMVNHLIYHDIPLTDEDSLQF